MKSDRPRFRRTETDTLEEWNPNGLTEIKVKNTMTSQEWKELWPEIVVMAAISFILVVMLIFLAIVLLT